MGCLVAFRCPPDSRAHLDADIHPREDVVICGPGMRRERTNPDACPPESQTPFDTFATIPPESLFENKCHLKERKNDPPISGEQVARTSGKRSSLP